MEPAYMSETFNPIPLIVLFVFLVVMTLFVVRRLGIKTYEEFATANRAVNFVGIALAIYTSWHVAAIYTAWAGFAVGFGFLAFYTLVYGCFGLVTMMLCARKSFLWGKKYGCQTQADIMGLRYQSKELKVLIGVLGIILSIPWIFMEFVTLGIAFEWSSYGTVPAWVGILIGTAIVGGYIAMGGMKAAITAAIFQGGFQFIVGCGLFLFVIFSVMGGFGDLFRNIQVQEPELLFFPGPGAPFPVEFWTSIIITSSFGNFMWPWIYNKIITADSVRAIKFAALGAPILGAITWTLFVFVGMGAHLFKEGAANPQEALFLVHNMGGPLVLGLFVAVVVATAISTVAAIVQAIATHVTVDIAQVFRHSITDKQALMISRVTVGVSCVVAFVMSIATSVEGLIFWALLTYQGMVLFWPIVVLGYWWKRANATGALIALAGGITLSWTLSLTKPAFVAEYGWTEGMYASAFAFLAMFIAGIVKKPAPHVELLFRDTDPEPFPPGVKVPTVASTGAVPAGDD